MTRYRVDLSSAVRVAAQVDVELGTVATWLVRSGRARTLVEGLPRPAADEAAVQQALERNPHLRDVALQLWAADQLGRRTD